MAARLGRRRQARARGTVAAAPGAPEGRRPHVLVLVENLPVPFDRRVWMIATALRGSDHDVTVVCPTGKGFDQLEEEIDGISVRRHVLPDEGRGLAGFAREYASALWAELRLARATWRSAPFDVVHICNPPDLLFLVAGWFRLRHGVKVVYDQHDLVPGMFQAKYGRTGLVHRALLLLERLSYVTAHEVITTNETARSVATGRGGRRPQRVHVVGNGPDPATFGVDATPDPAHRRGRRHLVGYVGIMGDQDGVDHLLRAVAHVVHGRGRRDLHVCCIGGGPAFDDLRTLAVALGIDDVVEFTGVLYGREMTDRLASADVCVDPEPVNGYSEHCTTNKVLEYMALGKPVVQYEGVEGRRSAGQASLYARPNDPVDLGERLIELLDDDVRREAMGREARRRIVESLGWPHQRERLLEVYAGLVGQPAGR